MLRSCEMSYGQSGTERGFLRVHRFSPSQYHSTIAPYSFLSYYYYYQNERQVKFGKPKIKNFSFE
jgi:hypothetical protein